MVVHALIPTIGRQKQMDLWIQGQPGLHSAIQESSGYIMRLWLKKKKKKEAKKTHRDLKLVLHYALVLFYLTILRKAFEGGGIFLFGLVLKPSLALLDRLTSHFSFSVQAS